ncbi:MAG: hypothetical protein LBM20_07115 [Rikenellaceae bacterium]|jgi:thymidine kinase|nr:hypothetical protein [Rikenellaceae bacterium]
MEKRKMEEYLRVLESFKNDGEETTFIVAQSYFKRNPELYELLTADENANALDQFFLDDAKFFKTDLKRAISRLEKLIDATKQEILTEETVSAE